MNTLQEHLENAPVILFEPEEWSEPLLGAYMLLRVALRDHCDEVTLSHAEAVWARGGVPVGRFPLVYGEHFLYPHYREAFARILSRDQVVREHVRFAETDDGMSLHIDQGVDPNAGPAQ
jgi:hypothetical protein